MVEVLKQVQYEPLPTARQIIIIYAGTNGFLDDLEVGLIKKFEQQLYKFIDVKYPGIQAEIESKNDLDSSLKSKLDNLINDFKKEFLANP
jgi:F-type H+-transporting ATPase subunit alpha